MAWQFTMEFSGITLLHLTKNGRFHTGVAYFSKGRSGNHKPFLYVPMEGLRDARVYATPKLRKAFGLRVIAAPGGGYLLEVSLKGSQVTFQKGLPPGGDISFQSNLGAGLDWRDLDYSADIKALAQKGNPKRKINAGKATGKVVLPAGTLVSLPAPPPGDPKKVYSITAQEKGKKEVLVARQPVADRLALVTQCTSNKTRITVKNKAGLVLPLTFGPADYVSPLGIAFSSNCAAGSGTADELSDYVPLLTPQDVTFRLNSLLATDDHPCISGRWIE